ASGRRVARGLPGQRPDERDELPPVLFRGDLLRHGGHQHLVLLPAAGGDLPEHLTVRERLQALRIGEARGLRGVEGSGRSVPESLVAVTAGAVLLIEGAALLERGGGGRHRVGTRALRLRRRPFVAARAPRG